MNLNKIYESDIEEAALEWLAELGYTVLHGPDIAPDTPDAERSAYNEVILTRRLRDAVADLNPNIPAEAQQDAIRKVLNPDSHTIVLFINGLPLAIIELKNPTDEKATLLTAFRQIQTYKQEIPVLFTYNETILISDGLEARIGSLTADTEWFLPWRTIEGEDEAPSTDLELEVLLRGAFEKQRFLRYLKHFIVFEETEGIAKKIAGYHQFHAVKTAVPKSSLTQTKNRTLIQNLRK